MGRCKEENETLLVVGRGFPEWFYAAIAARFAPGQPLLSDAADARWLQARTQLFRVDTALGVYY
jgi:hypothetical protein